MARSRGLPARSSTVLTLDTLSLTSLSDARGRAGGTRARSSWGVDCLCIQLVAGHSSSRVRGASSGGDHWGGAPVYGGGAAVSQAGLRGVDTRGTPDADRGSSLRGDP